MNNPEREKTEAAVKAFNEAKYKAQDRMVEKLTSCGIEHELDPFGNAIVKWVSYMEIEEFKKVMDAARFKVIK